jgi:hypothetical protein
MVAWMTTRVTIDGIPVGCNAGKMKLRPSHRNVRAATATNKRRARP